MTPEELRAAAFKAILDIGNVADNFDQYDGPWPALLEIQTILAELKANA